MFDEEAIGGDFDLDFATEPAGGPAGGDDGDIGEFAAEKASGSAEEFAAEMLPERAGVPRAEIGGGEVEVFGDAAEFVQAGGGSAEIWMEIDGRFAAGIAEFGKDSREVRERAHGDARNQPGGSGAADAAGGGIFEAFDVEFGKFIGAHDGLGAGAVDIEQATAEDGKAAQAKPLHGREGVAGDEIAGSGLELSPGVIDDGGGGGADLQAGGLRDIEGEFDIVAIQEDFGHDAGAFEGLAAIQGGAGGEVIAVDEGITIHVIAVSGGAIEAGGAIDDAANFEGDACEGIAEGRADASEFGVCSEGGDESAERLGCAAAIRIDKPDVIKGFAGDGRERFQGVTHASVKAASSATIDG